MPRTPGLSRADLWVLQGGWNGLRLKIFEWQICWLGIFLVDL